MQGPFVPPFSIYRISIGLKHLIGCQGQLLQKFEDWPETIVDRCAIDISQQCIKRKGFDPENDRRLGMRTGATGTAVKPGNISSHEITFACSECRRATHDCFLYMKPMPKGLRIDRVD